MHHGVVTALFQIVNLLACQLVNFGVNSFLEVNQSFCHSTIECYHSRCTVGFRTYGTELKAVARERKWRCAVTVGIVNEQFRYFGNVHLHALLASYGEDV